MNVLLTSCGLETETIKRAFLERLPKQPQDVRALFIPTAANTPDAIEVLPKCLNDLLKCGVRRENMLVYDLYDALDGPAYETYDVIYLCGGTTAYLLRRIHESGFREELESFLAHDGVVLGVSAGSLIFAGNLPDNLGLLPCRLDVHCDDAVREKPGRYPKDAGRPIKLGNRQAILLEREAFTIIE